jgi:chromosome segregation ATPase
MLPSERTNTIQPNPIKHDLDSTDELPVLDVVAYEANLAETQQGLSRTDTWTVEALQDIDEIVDSVQIASSAPTRVTSKELDRSELTVNVNRILKRISDLESDIVTAHEANAALQKRADAFQAERDTHAARIQALEAENARISEHRTLAEEMTQRLEQQLRDQAQRQTEAERRLAQMAAEHERRVAHMAAERGTLQQSHGELQEQLRAVKDTADQQALALSAAAKALSNEQASTAQLARRLAVKLTDFDKLQSLVDLRTRTIEELTEDRDEFSDRLEEEVAARAEVEKRFAVAEQSLTENHELLLERETALTQKEHEIAKLTAEIAQLHVAVEAAERKAAASQDDAQTQIRVLTEARDALLPASSDLAARIAEIEKLAAEVAKLRKELSTARADTEASAQLLTERADELNAEKARFKAYETEMEKLEEALRARDELAENLRGELETALGKHAITAGQLEKARGRVKSLSQEIFRRDHQIVELQADLAVHTEALAAIRQDVNRVRNGDNVDAAASSQVERVLEPFEHNGPPIILAGKMLTVGRTSENDICLPSKLVSRHHARLLVGPNGVIVEDAGSTNGCYVNGEQVRHHLMRDGDLLELGDMRYRLRSRALHDTAVHPNVVQLFEDPDDEFRTR